MPDGSQRVVADNGDFCGSRAFSGGTVVQGRSSGYAQAMGCQGCRVDCGTYATRCF